MKTPAQVDVPMNVKICGATSRYHREFILNSSVHASIDRLMT
jgi:hypothetical protein